MNNVEFLNLAGKYVDLGDKKEIKSLAVVCSKSQSIITWYKDSLRVETLSEEPHNRLITELINILELPKRTSEIKLMGSVDKSFVECTITYFLI